MNPTHTDKTSHNHITCPIEGQEKASNDHIGNQINKTMDYVNNLREYCKNETITNETLMTFKYLILLKEILYTDNYIRTRLSPTSRDKPKDIFTEEITHAFHKLQNQMKNIEFLSDSLKNRKQKKNRNNNT